ncbi:hypothetical protein F4774DRAFT_371663 [Daldinia eschscholtzii]|nr:hypothetical protein F4774DRAFT_371663 [Daldinia eschscholtzii]
MRRWFWSRSLVVTGLRGRITRHYSAVANDVERISLTVGSSGSTIIDLHNTTDLSPQSPLLIYLPPFSTTYPDKPLQLPKFLRKTPTAVINYRWADISPFNAFRINKVKALVPTNRSNEEESSPPSLSWPVPIHDITIAYDWIIKNLSPPDNQRRNVYLYGSYLGASLAVSLALTETRPHERMAVRGCIAFNGIYNWTKFLRDHPINEPDPEPDPDLEVQDDIMSRNDAHFRQMKQYTEALFVNPSHLFDSFASPSLFFFSPELLVPPNFTDSALSPGTSHFSHLAMEDGNGELILLFTHPRRRRLVFPPRTSTLQIPETLLLHTKPPPLSPASLKKWQQEKQKRPSLEYPGNNFQSQAEELAKYMRASIDKSEVLRSFDHEQEGGEEEDDGTDAWTKEAFRRIQTYNVGDITNNYTLSAKGGEIVAPWLETQFSGKPLRTSFAEDRFDPKYGRK